MEESGLLKNFIQNKNGKSTQKLWDELKGIIFDIRYQFVPKKTTGKPAWREKGDIPISEEIRHAIKEKHRLHRNWMRSRKRGENNMQTLYKRARNKVKKLMVAAKSNYEKSICDQTRQNPKGFLVPCQKQTEDKINNIPAKRWRYESVEIQ